MLSIEDLQSLEETLSVLSSPRLLADIQESEGECAVSGPTRPSKDEALRLIRRP